jgi:hypothetical protein
LPYTETNRSVPVWIAAVVGTFAVVESLVVVEGLQPHVLPAQP